MTTIPSGVSSLDSIVISLIKIVPSAWKGFRLTLEHEILLLLRSGGGRGESKRDDDSSSLEEFGFEVEGYRIDFSKVAERYERCHKDAILFHCEQCGKVYIVPIGGNHFIRRIEMILNLNAKLRKRLLSFNADLTISIIKHKIKLDG